ncbi:MAG: YdcF family protein, partial [Pyrinomonadaceae bacterium]
MKASAGDTAAEGLGVRPAPRQGARRNSRARRVLLVALALLLVWPVIARVAAQALVARAELERADAIVVLAGSAAYRERARYAARLFREGRAPRVILTNDGTRGGWNSEKRRNPLFIERTAWELERGGVPAEKIEMLAEPASGTYSEAVQLRRHAAASNLKSLLVVTSAAHSRRALWTLRRVFDGGDIKVGLDPVPPEHQQTVGASVWWL